MTKLEAISNDLLSVISGGRGRTRELAGATTQVCGVTLPQRSVMTSMVRGDTPERVKREFGLTSSRTCDHGPGQAIVGRHRGDMMGMILPNARRR